MSGSPAPTPAPRGAPMPREIVATWVVVVAGISVATALSRLEPSGLLRANLAGLAALLFVLVPDHRIRARGEAWSDYGLPWWGLADRRTWLAWGRGAFAGLGVALVVLPAFAAVVVAVVRASEAARLDPRLPDGLVLAATAQFLAVALPEELFYRGWMQTGWARRGRSWRVLGAEIGPGFLATQALFAAGHLVSLNPWRLLTFFPGLLFGWLRARSGGVVAPAVLHALSNLLVLVLEASLVAPG